MKKKNEAKKKLTVKKTEIAQLTGKEKNNLKGGNEYCSWPKKW